MIHRRFALISALAVGIVGPRKSSLARARGDDSRSDLVVLLHGLSRTPRSMKRLERALAAEGYSVLNIALPTERYAVERLAERVAKEIEHSLAPQQKLFLVTHSLGGIVARQYLKTHPDVGVQRVVMLSPPNGGSELVDLLWKIPVVGRHQGPSRSQLGTREEDLPRRLGPVPFELGVIAGNRSLNPLFSLLIPGPDDGIVSVERTKVVGMKDFLLVPRTHTFIMQGDDAIQQTLWFLRNGEFRRSASATSTG